MIGPQPSPASRLCAALEQLADATPDDRGDPLEAGLGELEQQLAETLASLRIAEEVVVRHRKLLQVATELVEEGRRWSRS